MLDFDTLQLPDLRTFLAGLKPLDELAYRMALRRLFPRLRAGEWTDRIDVLLAELVKDTDGLALLLLRVDEIAERIKAGG